MVLPIHVEALGPASGRRHEVRNRNASTFAGEMRRAGIDADS